MVGDPPSPLWPKRSSLGLVCSSQRSLVGNRPAAAAQRCTPCGSSGVLEPSPDPAYSRAMKAAVIYENGGPDVLRYEGVPDPECPEGFVLVDVEAISIEGGDLLARAGSPPPAVPHVVGYLAAGAGPEVGAGVSERAPGDRV